MMGYIVSKQRVQVANLNPRGVLIRIQSKELLIITKFFLLTWLPNILS
jgi:hypothetical protein